MERVRASVEEGLSSAQVEERIAAGLINDTDISTTKSYRQIFYDNIFTLFNFINAILAVLIFMTGSFRNMLFLGVVFSNMFLGIFQEVRAKRTLDKISLIENMKVCVIRDGMEKMITVSEIVLDDIIKLNQGNQITADAILVEGMLEVDESLLSGESDTVIKKEGDFLYSGSYVSGSWGYARVEKVGDECYASQMVKDARAFSRYPSELRDTLNKIIKYIGIMIVPLGILLFLKDHFLLENALNDSILTVSAALIGMIPEGLVILTSIALAVGVINLAKHRTLVQELYCLETLARVDVLCLDKTGTITEGIMEVADVVMKEECDIDKIMGYLMYHLHDDNATYHALEERFPKIRAEHYERSIPFNSKRKYSGVKLHDVTYLMGAYEYLFKGDQKISEEIAFYAKQGYRVLVLAKKTQENMTLLGYLLLLDRIRESAPKTLAYFASQDVMLKVISGDHPLTVSQVAKRAGLKGYERYIDVSSLSDDELEKVISEYTIFGRVRPEQKKLMVEALKHQGHTVAMNGDGVNDVPAFKSADVSIAMASGSDIAKCSANLVLLDSDFAALPYVLNEGRRVINNIQRVATLFLTKTLFSVILSFATLFSAFEYPFVPIHLTFVSMFTIGIPAFLMALEPNHKRVMKNFLENVVCVSLPAALSVNLTILYFFILHMLGMLTMDNVTSLALMALSVNGLFVLYLVARPFTCLRAVIFVFATVGIGLGLVFGSELLSFSKINWLSSFVYIVTALIILLVASACLNRLIRYGYRYYFKKINKRK